MSIGLGIGNSISGKINGFGGGPSYDPDAVAFFTANESAGGTLSPTVKTEWDAFVLREKAASRYSKYLRLYPYLGGVINLARIDAISLASATNVNFVDADADATCGLQGDGSTKYLDTLFKPSTGLAGNNFMFYIINLAGATTGNLLQGAFTVITSFLLYESLGTSGISSNFNRLSGTTSLPKLAAGSSIYGLRTSNTDLRIFRDGVQYEINTTVKLATTLPNINLLAMATSAYGSPSYYTPSKFGCYMVGEGLTIADSQGFDTSYKTFLTNIGAI